MTYVLTVINVDGGLICTMLFNPMQAGWGELDPLIPLLGDESVVDCTLDSPCQEDKRALYRLRIERL